MFHGNESPCRCRCCVEDGLAAQPAWWNPSRSSLTWLDRPRPRDAGANQLLLQAARLERGDAVQPLMGRLVGTR